MVMLEPYEKLSEVYDKDWGKYSLRYLPIIEHLATEVTIAPSSAIDIACGTGNLVSALSDSYSVVGSDISDHMIHIAREKHPNSAFLVSDMAELRLDREFGLVLCPFDSINYITSFEKLSRVMRRVHALLSDSGWFLFDFNTEHLMIDKHHGSLERELNGLEFTQTCIYHRDTRSAETVFDFGAAGREIHTQRAYSYSEMRTVLEACGLAVLHALDLYDDSQLKDRSYKVMFQCRKA